MKEIEFYAELKKVFMFSQKRVSFILQQTAEDWQKRKEKSNSLSTEQHMGHKI